MTFANKTYYILLVSTLLFAICFLELAGLSHATDFDLTVDELDRLRQQESWPVDIPQDAGNELSGLIWAEKLGKLLFSDTDLSSDGKTSCSSCHQQSRAFSDNLAVGQGLEKGLRNTPGLYNVGLNRWFGWDGASDSLWAAALRAMLSKKEIGAEIENAGSVLRQKAFFIDNLKHNLNIKETVSQEQLVVYAAKVIAAYTRTLVSTQTPYDNFVRALQEEDKSAQTRYPVSAKRGLKIFFGEANCHVCHFGPNFSNSEFHDIGRPFFTGVGQVDPGRYEGIKAVQSYRYNLLGPYNGTLNKAEILKTRQLKITQSNFGQWKTPSLRNLVSTAPYMHDGSLNTLREVVDFYADIDSTRLHSQGEALLKPLELSEQQRQDLVSFLQSLSPLPQKSRSQ